MICLWQGTIHSVFWPHQKQSHHDLPAELWLPKDRHFQWLLNGVRLEFVEYIRLQAIPIYQICGPEILILSKNEVSAKFFSEFASLEYIAAKIKVRGGTDLGFDHLLVFFVAEGDEARIVARPYNSALTVDAVPLKKEVRRGKPQLIDTASQTHGNLAPLNHETPTEKRAADQPPSHPIDWNKTLQQTILAGMRLRGIRSHDKKFKKLYYGVFNLVEIAIESADPQLVTTTYIQEKVEATLCLTE